MFSLYKDPEGKRVFSSGLKLKAVPSSVQQGGIAADTTADSERKDSLGVSIALAMLGDDPKATVSLLNARIAELEEELRQSRAEVSMCVFIFIIIVVVVIILLLCKRLHVLQNTGFYILSLVHTFI